MFSETFAPRRDKLNRSWQPLNYPKKNRAKRETGNRDD